uniref:VWFA domain-containing protein n=1 Tax=Hyaloperonospora arabidopsidis (strain Emoy2) TaxID=559515 RepID=M4B1C1_HYAAE
MLLGNGKRLVDPTKIAIEEWHDEENIIELHPDFRMWVLANRPGFPFLGNNFFREIGDIFASHAIENPDEESELALLTAYAPNVPADILRQLCKAFAELRDLVENGTITYPYSTREAVAVAKHLQRFPTDEVGSVLANVFAFDAYDRAMLAQVSDVFVRHGILLSSSREVSSLEMNITTADGSRVGGLSTPKTGLDAPKYGKEDPKNDPHVGGNTWAGGTGGSDTAGLGGRGGPYRLDKGHPVYQVSQAKKDEVSAAARAKAHAIAQEALAEKLREIDMSDHEWRTYESFLKRVERESSQLRAILANLEIVSEERNWLRHQSSGELDDGKLVDGIAGEPLVFKRRGVSDSPFRASAGSSQGQDPKRMLFVMDVSGSMFRFNGQDARLERMLETSLMIMESFAGFERELDYSILGHSGDSPEIPFVEFGAPPKDRKERLQVLQRMVAHSQFCRSGDHTVEAIERGVQRVAALEGDERFVFVVSDANLERYGIEPRDLGRKLLADPSVQAHALFIASFADEAEQIRCALPNGRGHVCLDTSDLPRIFKRIFTSALGSN